MYLICTLLYSLLFGNLELLLKIMIGYIAGLNITILVSFVIPGVSVTREVNKFYLLFNKLFLSTDKSAHALAKLKVISIDNYISFKKSIKRIFALFIIFFSSQTSLRVGLKRIGFYCWKIFILDESSFAHVSYQKI
jgi:hypothetical protein